MLNLITWFEVMFARFSVVKLLFFPFFHTVLFEWKSLHVPILKQWVSHFIDLLKGGASVYIIWNLSAPEVCPFFSFIYLFRNLFISLYTQGCLFYAFGLQAYAILFILLLKFSSFGHWELSQLAPVFLSRSPTLFFRLFYWLHYKRFQGNFFLWLLIKC